MKGMTGEQVQEFLNYLDGGIKHKDNLKDTTPYDHHRAILETEAAELCVVRIKFKEIIEKGDREPAPPPPDSDPKK